MNAMKICGLTGCNKKHYAQGLCGTHYKRLWAFGTTVDQSKDGIRRIHPRHAATRVVIKRHLMIVCQNEGIAIRTAHMMPVLFHALKRPERFTRRGAWQLNHKAPATALTVRERDRISGGFDMQIVHADSPYDFADRTRFWIWVEKRESCWEWQGNTDTRGYGRLRLQGKRTGAHVISWQISNGPIPEGCEVDHKCHNTLCVNPDHLRAATHKQNLEHRNSCTAKSGYRGVHQSHNGWRGCVVHNYVKHYTPRFDTPEEANEAVTALRNQLFTHNLLDRV